MVFIKVFLWIIIIDYPIYDHFQECKAKYGVLHSEAIQMSQSTFSGGGVYNEICSTSSLKVFTLTAPDINKYVLCLAKTTHNYFLMFLVNK